MIAHVPASALDEAIGTTSHHVTMAERTILRKGNTTDYPTSARAFLLKMWQTVQNAHKHVELHYKLCTFLSAEQNPITPVFSTALMDHHGLPMAKLFLWELSLLCWREGTANVTGLS